MSQSIPEGWVVVRTTPEFTTESVPAGLRRAHRVADGVWGRLMVRDGRVRFIFDDAPDQPHTLAAHESIDIPPGRLHHVEPGPDARFVVEFYKAPEH